MRTGNYDVGADGPCTHLVTVELDHDYVDEPLRYLRCTNAGGGTLAIVAAGDEDSAAQLFVLAQHGELDRIAIRKVLADGTTATAIVGGY